VREGSCRLAWRLARRNHVGHGPSAQAPATSSRFQPRSTALEHRRALIESPIMRDPHRRIHSRKSIRSRFEICSRGSRSRPRPVLTTDHACWPDPALLTGPGTNITVGRVNSGPESRSLDILYARWPFPGGAWQLWDVWARPFRHATVAVVPDRATHCCVLRNLRRNSRQNGRGGANPAHGQLARTPRFSSPQRMAISSRSYAAHRNRRSTEDRGYISIGGSFPLSWRDANTAFQSL